MVFLLETSEELAEFVRTFSKAVAEKPAKYKNWITYIPYINWDKQRAECDNDTSLGSVSVTFPKLMHHVEIII